MFFGTNASLVKRQSATQTQPATGFLKTKFAHKAAVGDTQINLVALTTPTEMSGNGFSNPTGGQIQSAQLLFFRRNLRLWSSVRGDMTDFYQYTVSSSSVLTFIGFTAEEGEIFEGTIDYSATTGFNIAATISPPATGSLAAGTTDFNVGFSFQVNANSSTQMGNVTVYRGGQAQLRNVGNATASVSADGDYQEVDLGTGFGQIIRFNRPDPDNSAPVIVIPNGRLLELPTGSMMAVIENLNGQINSLATYVAALAGAAITTVLGSAATNTDLKAFGDRVIALEGNRARLDIANSFAGTNTFGAQVTFQALADASASGAGIKVEIGRSGPLRTDSQNVYTTTYTPTILAISQFSAITAISTATVLRVGNVVTVSGRFTGTTTASQFNYVSISLPIARSGVNTANTAYGIGVYDRASSSIDSPGVVTHDALANAPASATLVYLSFSAVVIPSAAGVVIYQFTYTLD